MTPFRKGFGADLSHLFPDGTEKSTAFVSRPLSKQKRNYSQRGETLAVFWDVNNVFHLLVWRHFILLMDRKPLVSTFRSLMPSSK